jgi:hypothetical protein
LRDDAKLPVSDASDFETFWILFSEIRSLVSRRQKRVVGDDFLGGKKEGVETR